MENLEWYPVYYNALETNVEVTKCGRVRKVRKDWYGKSKYCNNAFYGELDFNKLKLVKGYQSLGVQPKGLKTKSCYVHQLIASVFLDYKFENKHKLVIDHIDSNKENNNLYNLRLITNRENNSKERSIKSGLPVGVSFFKRDKKYRAQIYLNGKNLNLGCFNTIEEASEAYQNKLYSTANK